MNSTDSLASDTTAASLCNRLHSSANEKLCNQLHEPLDDRVAFYADAARSSATRRAYAADMAAFSAWGGRVPASPEAVASYLAASDSLAAATLRRRLAAIADAHQAVGHPDPTPQSLPGHPPGWHSTSRSAFQDRSEDSRSVCWHCQALQATRAHAIIFYALQNREKAQTDLFCASQRFVEMARELGAAGRGPTLFR